MKCAILSDIEHCQVKSKCLDNPHEWLHRVVGRPTLTTRDQTAIQHMEIVEQFGCTLISRWRFKKDLVIGWIHPGQSSEHHIDELSPRLIRIACHRFDAGISQHFGSVCERLQELGIRTLPVSGQTQQPSQLLEMTLNKAQRAFSQLQQCLSSHIRCY